MVGNVPVLLLSLDICRLFTFKLQKNYDTVIALLHHET